jgi:starch phosphorylase
LEASGTSGQKVVLNGGLNCSVLDGWWAEAYNGRNGFSIGSGSSHADDHVTDRRDAKSLYQTLEQEVIPAFFDRDLDGVPRRWIKLMMNSISTLAWRFSSHRMVMDYARLAYLPAADGVSADIRMR